MYTIITIFYISIYILLILSTTIYSSNIDNNISYHVQCTTNNRKAIVLALDGTKGDVFYYAYTHGYMPNLERLHKRHNTLSSICTSIYDINCAHTHSGNIYKSQFVTYGYHKHARYSEYSWLTAPGWASVLTGVDNKKHDVSDNGEYSKQQYNRDKRLKYPTFMKLAYDHNYVTAAAGGMYYNCSIINYIYINNFVFCF